MAFKHMRVQATVKGPDCKTSYELQGSADKKHWFPLDEGLGLRSLATDQISERRGNVMFSIHDQNINFYHRLTVAMEILIGGTQPILERINRVKYVLYNSSLTMPFGIFDEFFKSLETVETQEEAESIALHLLHTVLDQFKVINSGNEELIRQQRQRCKIETERLNNSLVAVLKQANQLKKECVKLKERIAKLQGVLPKATRRGSKET